MKRCRCDEDEVESGIGWDLMKDPIQHLKCRRGRDKRHAEHVARDAGDDSFLHGDDVWLDLTLLFYHSFQSTVWACCLVPS